jgi:hypothetical protein
MIVGRSFFVLTDHRPLVGALSRRSDPWIGRQQCQLSFIAEFLPMICHKAGQSDVVVDTLSSPAGDFSSPPPPLQPGDGCIAACSNLGEAAKGLTEVKAPSGVSFSPFATRVDISRGGWVFISSSTTDGGPGGVGSSAVFLSGLLAGAFIFFSQGVYHYDAGYIYNGRHIICPLIPPFADPFSTPSMVWPTRVFRPPGASSQAGSCGPSSHHK